MAVGDCHCIYGFVVSDVGIVFPKHHHLIGAKHFFATNRCKRQA
jgi:hypothetical protein